MSRWIAKRFPALLFVTGMSSMAVALVKALLDTTNPVYPMAALMIGAYLCWVALEAKVTFRTATDPASSTDRGSEQLYGVARMIMLLSAVFGPLPWTSWLVWLVLPPLLLTAGITLRLTAIRALGQFYSHRVRIVNQHRIVTTGPYRLLRHPAYTGMLLANLGMVMLFANPFSVTAFVVLFVPAMVNRIFVEERAMFTVAGYGDFAARRKRLLPFVW